jgi:hypothetical protein
MQDRRRREMRNQASLPCRPYLWGTAADPPTHKRNMLLTSRGLWAGGKTGSSRRKHIEEITWKYRIRSLHCETSFFKVYGGVQCCMVWSRARNLNEVMRRA